MSTHQPTCRHREHDREANVIRRCTAPVVRCIEGENGKTTSYCAEHGPAKAEDWSRLQWLPGCEPKASAPAAPAPAPAPAPAAPDLDVAIGRAVAAALATLPRPSAPAFDENGVRELLDALDASTPEAGLRTLAGLRDDVRLLRDALAMTRGAGEKAEAELAQLRRTLAAEQHGARAAAQRADEEAALRRQVGEEAGRLRRENAELRADLDEAYRMLGEAVRAAPPPAAPRDEIVAVLTGPTVPEPAAAVAATAAARVARDPQAAASMATAAPAAPAAAAAPARLPDPTRRPLAELLAALTPAPNAPRVAVSGACERAWKKLEPAQARRALGGLADLVERPAAVRLDHVGGNPRSARCGLRTNTYGLRVGGLYVLCDKEAGGWTVEGFMPVSRD